MDIIRADQIKVGDYVDLEFDPYADPDSENIQFETEYAVVEYIERETPDCVAIGFEGFDVVGFPPNHVLSIWRVDG